MEILTYKLLFVVPVCCVHTDMFCRIVIPLNNRLQFHLYFLYLFFLFIMSEIATVDTGSLLYIQSGGEVICTNFTVHQ